MVLLAVAACLIASVLIASRRSAEPSARPAITAATHSESRTATVPVNIAPATAPEDMVVEKITMQPVASEKSSTKLDVQKQSAGGRAKQKEPIQDPSARAALGFVGADPEAEQYWVAAINDPSLSANERKDLIEDLNEDGLSDPKHPGPQDLPLILNRLQLIEELGPYAMDQVNADAFQEAQKDLLAMLEGRPVQ